jgi:hypothetical protein
MPWKMRSMFNLPNMLMQWLLLDLEVELKVQVEWATLVLLQTAYLIN